MISHSYVSLAACINDVTLIPVPSKAADNMKQWSTNSFYHVEESSFVFSKQETLMGNSWFSIDIKKWVNVAWGPIFW